MQKWMKEQLDMFVFLGLIMGLVFFFCCYWKESYQIRCAEAVLEEFLVNASAKGKITSEDYEILVRQIDKINESYELNLSYTKYVQQPVYAQIPEEKLEQYYISRNVRKKITFSDFDIRAEEEAADSLCLQKETNESILAAEKSEYLPLPDDGVSYGIEAVRKKQKVYEGEALITLCKVASEEGNYYVEAKPAYADSSGVLYLEVKQDTGIVYVPVEVICYPRTVICINGHRVVNTESIIETAGRTGQIDCPYCKVLPEKMESNTSFLYKKTGSGLAAEEIWLEVTFMDGHVELVTPEQEDWQDNYDRNYCGLQGVVIQYRGLQTAISVLSENETCMQCFGACNERCLADYVSFPYCTECMSRALLFTGEVYEEEYSYKMPELISALDQKGEVQLGIGDYVQGWVVYEGEHMTLMQKVIRYDGSVGDELR